MADEADIANDTAELFLNIAKASVPVAVPSQGIGICIECGVEVEGDRRWCSAECRDEFQWATNRGAR